MSRLSRLRGLGSIDVAANDGDRVTQGLEEGQVDSIEGQVVIRLSVSRAVVVVVVVVVDVSGERAWEAGDKGPKSRHRVGQVLVWERFSPPRSSPNARRTDGPTGFARKGSCCHRLTRSDRDLGVVFCVGYCQSGGFVP